MDEMQTMAMDLAKLQVHFQALWESAQAGEARFRSILDSSPDAIFTTDLNGRYTSLYGARREVEGVPDEDLIGQVRADLLGEEPHALHQARAEAGDSQVYDWQSRHGDQFFQSTLAPLRRRDGQVIGTVGVTRDVTHQRQAEAQRSFLGRLLDGSSNEILVVDFNSQQIRLANRAVQDNLGFDLPELQQKKLFEVLARSSRGQLPLQLRALAANADEVLTWEGEFSRRDGTTYPVEMRLQRMKDGREDLLLVMGLDISDRSMLASQMRYAQRMEALGRLTAGIAHDFNNLLTVIGGAVELVRLPADHPLTPELEAAREAVQRASTLSRRLLTFSRPSEEDVQALQLASVVADVQRLLTLTLGEAVSLEVEAAEGGPWVRMDASHLDEVLLHSAMQMRDVLPRGGTCRIRIESGPRAVVAFEADGAAGQLDLALINDLLRSYGGEARLTPKGIELQLIPCEPDASPAAVEEELPETPARGCILVVEDDPLVRKLAARILRQAGYEVEEADGGRAALRWLDTANRPIHLLVTDLVMPDMSGLELAREVRSRQPQTAISDDVRI